MCACTVFMKFSITFPHMLDMSIVENHLATKQGMRIGKMHYNASNYPKHKHVC